jgi:HlyD family secretion protein
MELRSDELHEVMGRVPPWILRRGIRLLLCIVTVIFIGSAFFKYPDVIVAEMTLTGRLPVAPLVARASGKLSALYVVDGQDVAADSVLAVIENAARTEDVLWLKGWMGGMEASQKFSPNLNKVPNLVKVPSSRHCESSEAISSNATIDCFVPRNDGAATGLALGEIQSVYGSFLNVLNEYNNYYSLNYYGKKIENTRSQVEKYRQYYACQQRQQSIVVQQHIIASQQMERDSMLFAWEIITSTEYDNARMSFLQSRYSLESSYASLENLQIQIGEMENNLLDMELQKAEKESVLANSLHTVAEQLQNALNAWQLTYCLTAPIDGKVTFTKIWHENQFVQSGEAVFTIVPAESEELLGKALLPIARSGKVEVGQRVIVRFANYLDEEYGIVNGLVSSISMVPTSEDNFLVEIALPDGLITNYGKTLPVTFEMKASAEIVTQDVSLLERFVMPLRKIFAEGNHNP